MSDLHSHHQQRSFSKKLRRALLTTALVAGNPLLYGIPVMAATPPAGQLIQNQATGSFIDTDNTEKAIESNVVQVTVAEITGISMTASGTTGIPALNSTVYFYFTISNDGNDPTQFFIPGAPSVFSGGTPGPIEVYSYDADGSGAGAAVTLSGVTVPGTGAATGALPNASTFNNGSIPAGGTIVVRVPMTVTTTGGMPISVTLGDTAAPPNNNNQDYSTTTSGLKDFYTQDNSLLTNGDLVSGLPINGDTTLHRKEASASNSINAISNITGTVFEDVNYGGGIGRPFGTAGSVARPDATVELYTSSGTYIASTTTNGIGKYTFTNTVAGDYIVRVVNSTVTSSRAVVLGLLPVQTFRTDAGGTAGVVNPVDDRVGGEKPSEVDAPVRSGAQTLTDLNNLTGQEVQSLTTVKVGTSDVTGIDFGYNFDTIVNTNDAGQGSLRQFILNSNALPNGSIDQVQNPNPKPSTIALDPASGVETSIFMIPASAINGTGGNLNAAVINLASTLSITDSSTSLDATTQTINIGNSNIGTVGTGSTVGVDGLTLDTIPKPEIVLNLQGVAPNSNAIIVTGQSTILKGFASYGYQSFGGLGTMQNSAIVVRNTVLDASPTIITQLLGGTLADGSNPGVPTAGIGHTFQVAGAANISNNYLAYNADAIEFWNTNGSHVSFINNELAYNGPKDNNSSNVSGIYSDQIETVEGAKNVLIQGNLVRNSSQPNYPNSQGQGIQINYSSFITLKNNTFIDNNVYGINASASDTLIQKNIITGTKNTGLGQGSGIAVYYGGPLSTGLRNQITQNSIFQNAKLGIDHQMDGVSANDGLTNASQPNNGIDYPIITSSTLTSGALTVKGYVGKETTPGAGDIDFANVTLEFFIADDDGNNNGEVILGDLKSKPHGEGKTYIGSCTTDANGLFGTAANPCTFSNAVTSAMTASSSITATATDSSGNTSEFSAPAVSNPNVLLVKRITAINGNTTNGTVFLNSYDPDPVYPYDKNVIVAGITPATTDKWPSTTGSSSSTFLLGARDGGVTKPSDEVEYTIYFLSAGTNTAQAVQLCDRLPDHQAFVPNAYNFITPGPGVAPAVNADRGIALSYNGSLQSYTNLADGDIAQYYPPGQIPLPNVCKTVANPNVNSNPTGAVVINLGAGATGTTGGDLPSATASGNPIPSYGFVRFKVKNTIP
jgi:SdrD B-like domain/Right handed beta helix region